MDNVIPFHQGQELYQASVGEPRTFIDRHQMTHNDFNMNRDLLSPLREFLIEAQIDTSASQTTVVPTFSTQSLEI